MFQKQSLPLTFSQFSSADDSTVMDLEGVSDFAQELGLEPDDNKVTVLLWRLGAGSISGVPGTLSKAEFVEGMEKLGAMGVEDLKKRLNENFDVAKLSKAEFKECYKVSRGGGGGGGGALHNQN